MNRRDFFLGAAAGGALIGAPRLAAATPRPRNLVTVFAAGGWDVTMSFAPRLDDPFVDGPRLDEDPSNPNDREYLRRFGDIELACNDVKRPSVTAFFERWGSQCAVVNGVFTGAVGHETATVRVLTGTPSFTAPDMGAIVGHTFGGETPLGYVALAGTPFLGPFAASSGRVGFNSQLRLLLDDSEAFPPASPHSPAFPLTSLGADDRADVRAFAMARADRLRRRRGEDPVVTRMLDDLDESWRRADRFETSAGDLVAALSLGKRPSFTAQGTMAAELLARDVCRAVLLDSNGGWDTHVDNAVQHVRYQSLFVGLDHLMQSLHDLGQLDHTLVAVVSEMTRTPKLNANLGKDHWPHTSVLLLGAGVRGGASLGGYDAMMESLPQDFATGAADPRAPRTLRHDHLAAGLLAHLDIDPARYLPEAIPYRGFVA